MKYYVNIETDQVWSGHPDTSNYCTFAEAGLEPNGERITDRDEIEEHLKESRGAEEVIFVGNSKTTIKINKDNQKFHTATLNRERKSMDKVKILREKVEALREIQNELDDVGDDGTRIDKIITEFYYDLHDVIDRAEENLESFGFNKAN